MVLVQIFVITKFRCPWFAYCYCCNTVGGVYLLQNNVVNVLNFITLYRLMKAILPVSIYSFLIFSN